MNIDITKNSLDTAEAFILAFGGKAKPAVARAVNRSVKGVRTDGVKLVRSEYNVKAGVISKAFTVRRATKGNLEAVARVSGNRISLIHFDAKPSIPGGRKPAIGVSVKVKKQRKVIRHSFVARMRKNSSVGVFVRKGKERFPILKKYSLAVPEMMDRDDIREEIQKGADKRFGKTLNQEINYMLQKAGAK